MARSRNPLRILAPLAALFLATGAAGSDSREAAWLGIFLGDALDGGVQIVAVVPDGPAARGGLQPGDVVLAVDGSETENRLVLGDAVDRFRPGETVSVRILRDGRVEDLEVRAGRSPVSLSWRVESPPPPPAPPFPIEAFDGFPGPVLGMTFREIQPELRRHFGAPGDAGILVAAIEPGSPGARAGVRVGDVVVRLAGRPVARVLDLSLGTARAPSGGTLALEAVRGGRPVSLRLEPDGTRGRDVGAIRKELMEREAEIRRLRLEVESLERALEESRREAEREGP